MPRQPTTNSSFSAIVTDEAQPLLLPAVTTTDMATAMTMARARAKVMDRSMPTTVTSTGPDAIDLVPAPALALETRTVGLDRS